MLDIDTSNTGNYKPDGKKVKYTPIEVAAANMAGMTIDEYKAVQSMSSIKEYESYKKNKIKN